MRSTIARGVEPWKGTCIVCFACLLALFALLAACCCCWLVWLLWLVLTGDFEECWRTGCDVWFGLKSSTRWVLGWWQDKVWKVAKVVLEMGPLHVRRLSRSLDSPHATATSKARPRQLKLLSHNKCMPCSTNHNHRSNTDPRGLHRQATGQAAQGSSEQPLRAQAEPALWSPI